MKNVEINVKKLLLVILIIISVIIFGYIVLDQLYKHCIIKSSWRSGCAPGMGVSPMPQDRIEIQNNINTEKCEDSPGTTWCISTEKCQNLESEPCEKTSMFE